MASCAGTANFSCTGPYGRLCHHIDCPRPVPMVDIFRSILDDTLPGPIDGIFREIPITDILRRCFGNVLKSMENYHRVAPPYARHSIERIDRLKQEIAAHFWQSYRDRADQRRIIRNWHHWSMAGLVFEIRRRDCEYREALYDLLHYLEVGEPLFDWNLNFSNPKVFLDRMVSWDLQYYLKLRFLGSSRIRRRNKQRWRRALRRVTLAKDNLESSIQELLREAMLYHLICSIGMAPGIPFELSCVSGETDVIVIQVMISLFCHQQYWVTSHIDLVERLRFHFARVTQDGDEPLKYWIQV